MKKSPTEPTTAKNLEEKFERGEEVLDYFDGTKARVIRPQSKDSVSKTTLEYSVKRTSGRRAVVREKSARYRKKK
jgi:hypothetical protein